MLTSIRRVTLTTSIIVYLAAPGFAQLQGPPAPVTSSRPSLTSFGSGDLVPSLGRLALTLVLVIALIWATMWVARRFLKGRVAKGGQSDAHVVERLFLAPKKSIEIVSIGNRLLVLGVTEDRISMLTELEQGNMPAVAGTNLGARRVVEPNDRRERDLLRQARTKMRELFQAARVQNVDTLPQG